MKILITGGAGFIGSHTSEHFLKLGHKVLVLDNLSSGKRENLPADVEFFECCITSSTAREVILENKPEGIVHLAAQMDVRKSVENPSFDAQMNVAGIANILQAAVDSGTSSFIFSSTGGAIYGEADVIPTPESHPIQPEAPYGLSKWCGEHYLNFFARTSSLRTVALRFGNIYGPRQDPHGEAGVVAIFCQRLLKDDTLKIFGDGRQTRDYVHVSDVVRAIEKALSQSAARGSFNIGTGIGTDVLTLVEHLSRAAGKSPSPSHEPARSGELQHSALDARRAEQELDWQPTMSIDEGLKNTFEWFAGRTS